MTGSAAIDFLIVLGIACILIVTVIKVVQSLGIQIPQLVWIIGGAIVGIILLIWLGKMLPALLP
jgi:hypothetical protein